jgi:hypothetical protein
MPFTSYKRTYDDDDESSLSSCPDSPTMYPLLLKDQNGRKKFIFSHEEAIELSLRVERRSQEVPTKVSVVQDNMTTKKKRTSHGLAPRGMKIPKKGEAYLVGGGSVVKEVVKESNLEKFNRIGEEQREKKKRKDMKLVKKLKKDGKVSTLAPYMYT